MERELEWWKDQLAADIHQSLRIKVSLSELSSVLTGSFILPTFF